MGEGNVPGARVDVWQRDLPSGSPTPGKGFSPQSRWKFQKSFPWDALPSHAGPWALICCALKRTSLFTGVSGPPHPATKKAPRLCRGDALDPTPLTVVPTPISNCKVAGASPVATGIGKGSL